MRYVLLATVLCVGAIFGHGSGLRAATLVEPTAGQAERCRSFEESFRNFCLSGYKVAGLRLPTEATTFGAFSSTGGMALYKPDGPGPFPAMIIMHTCGSIVAEQARYWVKASLENGYAAFLLDSWSQRGLPNGSCDVSPGFNTITVRIRDAFDALARLAEIPSIDIKRVGAIGFSHGGRIAYMLANPGVTRMYAHGDQHFAASVAVYGECYNRPSKFAYLRPPVETPLLALLGDHDDDGDVRECTPRLEAMRAAGLPVDWHIFPGAGHAWDQPNFRTATMRPYPGGVSGSVLYKYDAKVTDETRDRAYEFLNAHLKN